MVIQKISIRKCFTKHLNTNFQCFHTLEVIRMHSIRDLDKLQRNQYLNKRFTEPIWAVVGGLRFNRRLED